MFRAVAATLLHYCSVYECDVDAFAHWLSHRQMKWEGGFQGRTNKLVDGCYSFWQGAAGAVLAQCDPAKYTYVVYAPVVLPSAPAVMPSAPALVVTHVLSAQVCV
jgi:prenyltransferase beta subunit